MLKQLVDSGKAAFSVYKRLVQTEENNKKLEDRANRQDDKIERLGDALKDALYELKLSRQIIESNQKITERDQRILFLQLESFLKENNPRALPPAPTPQYPPEIEARIAAIENAIEELKGQIKKLKNS